jgi:hypothetical protein
VEILKKSYGCFPESATAMETRTSVFFWLRADYFCKHLIGDYSRDVDIEEINREIEMSGELEAFFAPIAASAEASSASIAPRAGLVDFDGVSFQVSAVKPIDRRLGFGTVGHLNKSESSGLSCVPICDDFYRCDLSERFKGLTQIFLSGFGR